MALLDEAYSNILGGFFTQNYYNEKPIGILIGKVVGVSYYLYKDNDKYYTFDFVNQNNEKIMKKIQLDLNNCNKNCDEVIVPLIGLKYKVIFFINTK